MSAQGARARASATSAANAPVGRIDAYLRRASAFGQFNGAALVAEHGRIVYQRAFGEANREWHVPNTIDTRFEIASMTKAMTALVVMQLVEEGKVRLDGHVSDYLSSYPQETGRRITIDQLLTHTSGLQQDIAFADDPVRPPAIVAAINADLLTNDSLVALIAQRPLRFEPGAGYAYSSDGYAVLGAVIAKVTGISYWEALERRVLDRAGMHQTGVSLLKPLVEKRAAGYARTFDGYENAPHIGISPAGGLYSTIGDLYRFDRALQGDALVKLSSKERLFATRSVITAYGWKTAAERRPDGTERRILRTTGGLPGFAALLVRAPSEQRTIILLSNTRDVDWRFDDFAVGINHILDGEPYTLPRRSAAMSLAEAVRHGTSGDALRARFQRMRSDSTEYGVVEAEMNRLGYHLLSVKRRIADAVSIFAMNVAAFPGSANVYDSLGEALLAQGDTARAISNYRESVARDPGNANAVEILKRLDAVHRR